MRSVNLRSFACPQMLGGESILATIAVGLLLVQLRRRRVER